MSKSLIKAKCLGAECISFLWSLSPKVYKRIITADFKKLFVTFYQSKKIQKKNLNHCKRNKVCIFFYRPPHINKMFNRKLNSAFCCMDIRTGAKVRKIHSLGNKSFHRLLQMYKFLHPRVFIGYWFLKLLLLYAWCDWSIIRLGDFIRGIRQVRQEKQLDPELSKDLSLPLMFTIPTAWTWFTLNPVDSCKTTS